MGSERTRWVAVALAVGSLAIAAPAAAQQPPPEPTAADKETARSLMDQGDERMEAKDYPGALKAYQAADAVMHLPMTGIALARAQAAAGFLVEARDTALQVTQLPKRPNENAAYTKARAEAGALADKLAPRIPSIQVQINDPPAGVVVSIDGAPLPSAAAGLPRKLNPGKHVITAMAPSFEPSSVEVVVPEGVTIPVVLALRAGGKPGGPATPEPPPRDGAPPSPRRTSPLVFIGFGVGGAGIVVGAASGGLALAATASLKNKCTAGVCPHSTHDDLAKANALANVSDAMFALGVAGVGVGVAGVILSRPRAQAPAARVQITPLLGPGTIGAQGAF